MFPIAMDVTRIYGTLAQMTKSANEYAESGGMNDGDRKDYEVACSLIADSMKEKPEETIDGLMAALHGRLKDLVRGSAFTTDCKRAMDLGSALRVFDEFALEEANGMSIQKPETAKPLQQNVPPKA
jgi:hypothetical protein